MDVGRALFPAQKCLGLRGLDSLQQLGIQGNTSGAAEAGTEALGLVEFPFALFGGVERDGDDHVPGFAAEFGGGFPDEEIGEEGLEPEGALVFVAVDDVQYRFPRQNGGAGVDEVEFHFTAVFAFEGGGDVALIGQAATLAEGRFDEANFLPAIGADEAIGGGGAGEFADLAVLGIKEAQGGFEWLLI